MCINILVHKWAKQTNLVVHEAYITTRGPVHQFMLLERNCEAVVGTGTGLGSSSEPLLSPSCHSPQSPLCRQPPPIAAAPTCWWWQPCLLAPTDSVEWLGWCQQQVLTGPASAAGASVRQDHSTQEQKISGTTKGSPSWQRLVPALV